MWEEIYNKIQQDLTGMWDAVSNTTMQGMQDVADWMDEKAPHAYGRSQEIEEARTGGDPVVLDNRPSDEELDIFLDTATSDTTNVVEKSPLEAQGFTPFTPEVDTGKDARENALVESSENAEVITAEYAKLWGDAYHTKAGKDKVKLADYKADVDKYAQVGTAYYKKVNPILLEVSNAFDGDEGISKDKLHKAMLEIGAHESEGGTQLVNSTSTARGVFQVLAPTAKENAKTPYYGPKAQAIAGKSRTEVANMTATQIKEWMRTNIKANAVMGSIELIKLAKAKNKLSTLQ